MSKETGRSLSVEESIGTGERPSDLQNRLNALAELGDFEEEGHHAHALEEAIDPTEDKTIAHAIEELGETPENPGGTPCEEDESDCYKRVKSYGPVRTYNERYSHWLLTGKLF